jgi:hypothetical protein
LKNSRKKTTVIAIAILLAFSMTASTMLCPNTLGQVTPPRGTQVPTYANLNVAPNPAGVGQTVTLAMFLWVPMIDSSKPVNFTIVEKTPDGTTTTLGPFTGDTTGGTFTTFVPDHTGNYTFQFFYAGQTLSNGVIEMPSHTDVVTLVVQQTFTPLSGYPITPLPSQWWETPVTAENVQNWYTITGPWLGYGTVTFASTGGYNLTGNYNPYTQSVLSGHVLWTKPWAEGGVAGGQAGPTESSHYWSTSQYWPKYAPVVINGIMYSTWYPETTGYSAGILATDLYTGKTLFRINTTNALQCGMVTQWKTINMYGVIGPYLWTTGSLPAADTGGTRVVSSGTQWNMYSAMTGQYVLSVVNGTSMSIATDDNGNMIGYYLNSTAGTLTTYGPAAAFGNPTKTGTVTITSGNPVLCCFNMSQALGNSWGWGPSVNTVVNFAYGIMWAKPIPTNISGVTIKPALSLNGITGNAAVMTGGFTIGQGVGGETNGWLVVAAMDIHTGAQLWCKNLTYPDDQSFLPFTRCSQAIQDGLFININLGGNYHVTAYDASTGTKKWDLTLTGFNGATPNMYDGFGISAYNGPGRTFLEGLGGDIWCINDTNGNLLWYTNTTELVGSPGAETPYGVWPLWVFRCCCTDNDVAYFAMGHEYDPPLFHGAQLLAINNTNGKLIWSTLDFSTRSTEVSYGIVLSLNCYDNQIYAFGKGPSATTVTAPNIGVTTATPITITGKVTDVSAGAEQDAVARNFPNGLPCVSDASESAWMEFVYQQQPCPSTVTGVPVSVWVLDSNNNYRQIGSTTTDGSGTYALTWTPDIPGNFTVVAMFAGSNSYYSSNAETHFYASAAAATPPPPQYPVPFDYTWTIILAAVAVIIVVIIATIILLLRKK